MAVLRHSGKTPFSMESLISVTSDPMASSGRFRNIVIERPSVLQVDLLLISVIVCKSSLLSMGLKKKLAAFIWAAGRREIGSLLGGILDVRVLAALTK